MVFTRPKLVASAMAVVIITCAVAAVAQGRSGIGDANSLAAVVAELRQLRAAVEELARTQMQADVLALQQRRLADVESRFDTVRREREALAFQSSQMATDLATLRVDASRMTAKLRPVYQQRIRSLEKDLDTIEAKLQQAQARESEASQTLKLEEARWAELMAKLRKLVMEIDQRYSK